MPGKLLSFLQRIEASRLHSIVITIGLIAMIGHSVGDRPALQGLVLRGVLWLCLGFFALEWAAAIYTCHRSNRLRDYLKSGGWVMDAASVLIVPLALAAGLAPVTAWLFGTIWVLKLPTVAPGLARLGRVISLEAGPLTSVFVLFFMVLLFSAMALHLLEGSTQPNAFGTVPASLWWAVVTLTTTGYGDAIPATVPGRLVAALVMICGVGVFGLLTSILATGFVEDNRRHSFLQNWNLIQNVPFFRCLEPAGVIELSRMLRRWEVAEDTAVIRRGRQGDCMYFVAEGEVEVQIEPQPIRLGPGAFFGEMALLGSGVRSATVTTTRPTTLLVLDLAAFRTFTAHHPVLAQAIEAEAQRRAGKRPADSGPPTSPALSK